MNHDLEISETQERFTELVNDGRQMNATTNKENGDSGVNHNPDRTDTNLKNNVYERHEQAENNTELDTLVQEDGSEGDGGAVVKAESSAQPVPQVTFPNGGWVAWLNVVGSTIVCFITLGSTQSFGAYQDYYTRVFLSDRTPSEISWIGSTQLFFMFFLGPISGKLFDEGYFRPLLASASVLYLFCHFMLSITKPHQFYEVFLAQGIGLGIAAGMMFLPSLSMTAHYFSVRRSLVMGIVISGPSLGGIVLPIQLNQLFHKSGVGFGWTVRSVGFIFLGLLIIVNLIMKPRFPGRKSPSKKDIAKLLKTLFTDVPYLLAVAGLTLVYWGLFYPFFYLQLFAVLHGINTQLAFYSITILNAASLVGRIVPNIFADSYGPLNTVIPFSICCGMLFYLMFAAKTVAGLVMFAILYGFTSGAVLSLTFPTITAFVDNISEVGLRSGVAMFFLSFALLIGNPIMGALLDAPRYTWYRAIIFSSVMVLAGAALLTASRMLLAKKRGRWRV